MKSILFRIPGILAFTFLFSQCNIIGSYEKGNGNVISETRDLGAFNKISVGGNYEVTLKKSDKNYLTITTDENLVPLILSKIENGELSISSKKNLINIKKTKLVIGYSIINEVRAYGATLLNNEETLESDNLYLNLEGAGMIDLKLKVSNLDASLSGAGLVKCNGYATNSKIRLSGAGGLEAIGLETQNATITVSGIGSAKVNVKNELSAAIEGVGGIEYIGHPVKVNKNISGLGTIKEEKQSNDESRN
jgi:hypothetical protein